GFAFGMALYPSLAIGGDLIDFYPGESGRNGRLGIMVADIAGHGVAAALLTMLFKSTAAEIFRTAATPAAGMTELNRRLATDFPESHFACATYLELTAGSRTIRFARGSQEPLLLLPAHGAISEYTDGGTPPGMFAPDEMGDISYTDQELTLAPGDTLLLYTDGVSEALSPGHTMLGPETLQRWISERRALPPAELVRELHTRVTGFTGTTRFEDDFTILALRAE
ncbi:MAG TPA: PP2C family protein-serine/threonine phosphatase, partial [bacterium]|nr:PP2C family protein-serine/threonine phosphatase [bacterium]